MEYYSWGLTVALRFSSNKEEAKEVLSNAFIKAFRHLDKYDLSKPFRPWFKKIIVRSAYDYYRNHDTVTYELTFDSASLMPSVLDKLSYDELLRTVQSLSPAYRNVFVLYVIEGYTHKEIAELLEISEGTSKSNLSKAKQNLIKLLSPVTYSGRKKSI